MLIGKVVKNGNKSKEKSQHFFLLWLPGIDGYLQWQNEKVKKDENRGNK